MTISNLRNREQIAAEHSARQAFFWNLGLRCFYFSFCVGGWIANPYACLALTLLIVVVMFFLDRSTNEPILVVEGKQEQDKKR